jgi:D-cysteine desulfhydrase
MASGSLLHERFPALRESVPHTALGERPTPVRRLEGLSAESGTEVWLKDDGAFGSGAWGGNKVRKLEWLLPEAERRGARTLVTAGGLGTNWGLAAALYGREQGLDTAIALVDQPVDEHVRAQLERLRASGAALHFTHTRARTIAAAPWLVLRHAGRRPPYVLPVGGSSPLGVLGCVEAGLELAGQVAAGELPAPAEVVVAAGSGGTAAGLAVGLGLAGLDTRVTGVVVTDGLVSERSADRLVRRTAALLRKRGAGPDTGTPAELRILEGYRGAGYGHPTPEGARAAELARRDGLELDPVYTAKAVAGLVGEARAGRLGAGPVLYLHTDGPRPAAEPGYSAA